MGPLKLLHYGFGAPELFIAEQVVRKGHGDGFQNSLRNVASHNELAYLTSPQIGLFWKTLVMLKKPYLIDFQWGGYKNLKNSHYGAYLNFQIQDKSKEQSQIWEQCMGYPGMKLLMPRSQKIKVKYQTEKKFEEITTEVQGFEAKVMQQAGDHLQALDPLMLARDIDVVNENLKKEHQESIRELLMKFMEQKKSIVERGEKFNYFKRIPSFNKLRREVMYSITDFYRK